MAPPGPGPPVPAQQRAPGGAAVQPQQPNPVRRSARKPPGPAACASCARSSSHPTPLAVGARVCAGRAPGRCSTGNVRSRWCAGRCGHRRGGLGAGGWQNLHRQGADACVFAPGEGRAARASLAPMRSGAARPCVPRHSHPPQPFAWRSCAAPWRLCTRARARTRTRTHARTPAHSEPAPTRSRVRTRTGK